MIFHSPAGVVPAPTPSTKLGMHAKIQVRLPIQKKRHQPKVKDEKGDARAEELLAQAERPWSGKPPSAA